MTGTNVATLSKPGPIDVFVGEVLPPDRMDLILGSLPAHVKPERFQRNLVIAITQHPKLLQCRPEAVFNEVSKAAALGLYLDPQLGEAYLITGWGQSGPAPQLRLGYRGLIKLARQSGQIAKVYAHEACQNDKFKMTLGTQKEIMHEPAMFADRGDVVLYYAVVQFSDGETDFEPMSIKEIHRIRDRSDGWKAFKAGKIKSTPWGTDEGEMSKKTVLRRLLKRIPQSPELADALQVEDVDYSIDDDLPPRPTLADRLAAQTQRGEGFSHQHVERELGPDSSQEPQPQTPQPEMTPASDSVPDAGTNSPEAGHVTGDDDARGGSEDGNPTPASDEETPSLPEGWEKEYAAALRKAQKPDGLAKYAKQFWPAHGGWDQWKDTPDGQTASIIFNAFRDHFGKKADIDAVLREVGAL